ncbi:hypothetical protein AZKH_1377 [Azoarcus sp. KH32C]|nr:hypothetical protein AZKH_1377 [Azoarcus sp. KH32C]
MQPGHYTELFFLDEPTSLAAGHRPCAECRRDRYKAFGAAWARAHSYEKPPSVRDIDAQLKRERTTRVGRDTAMLTTMPDGVVVKQLSSNNDYLIHAGRALLWGFEGYTKAVELNDLKGPFRILTPASTVRVLSHGYKPELHASCKSLLC